MKLYWSLFFIPLFVGCATHAPMSEMVMFSPKKVVEQADTLTYYSKYSFAISGEMRGIDYTALTDQAISKISNERIDESGKAPTMSLNSIFMNPRNTRMAWNVAMFPSIGVDATFQVDQKHYLTIGSTLWGGQQVIFQRKLFYNQKSGAAAGLFYEHLYQGSHEECYSICFSISPSDVFYINGIGIRGFYMYSDGLKNRSYWKINGKVGLIPDFFDQSFSSSIYGSVGLSFGLF